MKILVTMPVGNECDSFFSPAEISKWEELGEVVWNPKSEQFTPEELRIHLSETDVVVTGWNCPRLTEEVIADARRLKLVAHTGGTVAAVASPALYEHGVRVISGNKLFARSVAEGVVAYILAALRKIPLYSGELANGNWMSLSYPDTMNKGLLGKTVGVVSFGTISEYLVQLLQPFGVKLLVYSRKLPEEKLKKYHMTLVTLDELFEQSDVITIQTALNQHTYHMIGDSLLRKIKPGALFINTARGAVVDEAALLACLREKRFAAALDVYSQEPFGADSPWLETENVMLMPHMAGPTMDFRQVITARLASDVSGFFAGRELEYEIPADKAFAMSEK